MKAFTPWLLVKYICKEFSYSLFIMFSIIFSLLILTGFVSELTFFSEKNLQNNIIIESLILSLFKIPSVLTATMPFIFLFAGLHFYSKIQNNNELSSINLSGVSRRYILNIPAIYAFVFGILMIVLISPFSANLAKIYSETKNKFSRNENLMILSNTGLWLKDQIDQNNSMILRADRIENDNFNFLKNVSIFYFKNNILLEKIDADEMEIIGDKWELINIEKINFSKNFEITKSPNYQIYNSNIDIEKLKNIFSNSETVSIWDIKQNLELLRKRGYYGQELIIKLNKDLALPLFLLSMIYISLLIVFKKPKFLTDRFYMLLFLGIFIGILVYYLNEFSISLGKSNKVPSFFRFAGAKFTVIFRSGIFSPEFFSAV